VVYKFRNYFTKKLTEYIKNNIKDYEDKIWKLQ
jgi:hypothetical protein